MLLPHTTFSALCAVVKDHRRCAPAAERHPRYSGVTELLGPVDPDDGCSPPNCHPLAAIRLTGDEDSLSGAASSVAEGALFAVMVMCIPPPVPLPAAVTDGMGR